MIGAAHWLHAEQWSLRHILGRTPKFSVYQPNGEGGTRVVYDGFSEADAFACADYEVGRGRTVYIRPRYVHERWVQSSQERPA